MVKSSHIHIVNNKGKSILSIAGGIAFHFGLGFNISRWAFSIDIGPFWVALEW